MPSYNNNSYFERDRRGHEGISFRSSSARRRSPSQPRISERSFTAELENENALLVAENKTLKTQLGIHESRTRSQSNEIGRLEDRIRQLELAATIDKRNYTVLEDRFEAAEEKSRLLKRWTPTPGMYEDSGMKERLELKIDGLRVAIQERDERIRNMDVKLADLNLKVKTRDKSIAYLKGFLEDLGYRVDVNV
ncbi:hypothetical protein ACMFMG_010604 [Clarireedia jacksonii]